MPSQALSKSLARMAMLRLRDYPHFLARPLSLCFAFEPPDKQFFAASLLELGFTLDAAVATPRESLLAIIRTQWWVDSLQNEAQETVPLANNLRILCDSRPNTRDRLAKLIGRWQEACQNENRNSQPGWQALWHFLGEKLLVDPGQAVLVGSFAMSSSGVSHHEFFDRAQVLSLRHTAQTEHSNWLYLLACLGRYRYQKEQLCLQRQNMALLGWHILLWRLGWPPRVD